MMKPSDSKRARRASRGCVFKPTVVRKRNGQKRKVKAGFYWAKYRDAKGKPVRHAIKLSNGNGVRDKSVAEAELRKILERVEREAAGMIDPVVESAAMPMRVVLGRYVRHLRRKRRTQRHIKQVLSNIKWVIEQTRMERLANFTEDRVDRALGLLVDRDRSPRTINVYRRCLHAMAEWAVKIARILERNPVSAVERRNEKEDTRKVRRALLIEQATGLLRECGPRQLFYHVQLWTGLRVGETVALEWQDIHLDGDRPGIKLRAAMTKSRRADELPLHPSLLNALVAAKPPFAQPTDRVFKTAPRLRTFKRDLDRAGIPFEDDQGRTVDRHALRTTFISWLGLYGVDPRAQIVLARHAPQGITLKHYQDFSLLDLWAEIRKLPGPGDCGQTVHALATGTDGDRGVVPGVVPTSGPEGQNGASTGKKGAKSLRGSKQADPGRKPLKTSGFDAERARLSTCDKGPEELGATGFEPATSCSQSRRATGLRHAPPCRKS